MLKNAKSFAVECKIFNSEVPKFQVELQYFRYRA